MANLVPISTERHKSLNWRPLPNFRFAGNRAMFALGVKETPRAAFNMLVAFSRMGEDLNIVCVTGLEPNANHLVSPQGEWLSNYLPIDVRLFPFALGISPQNEAILCIFENENTVVGEGMGRPFFSFDGSLDPDVKGIMDALATQQNDKIAAQLLVKQLDDAGLICPMNISIDYPTGARVIEGLLQIDEARLETLSDDLFLELRRTGALVMAYCQMLSKQNLDALINRAKVVKAATVTATAVTAPMELDFSSFRR